MSSQSSDPFDHSDGLDPLSKKIIIAVIGSVVVGFIIFLCINYY
jgi:hypothetical protein